MTHREARDPATLRWAAWLAHEKAMRETEGEGDGLERLGAARALEALAETLRTIADYEAERGSNPKPGQG